MIYGIAGPAGAGKDTFGTYLAAARDAKLGELTYQMAFADPLRDMLAAGLGLTEEQMTDREAKELPVDGLGVSPRRLLQTLGTEWGRNMIRSDIWVREGMRRATERERPGRAVVITDVRFPAEAEAVREAGGMVVHVERPGTRPRAPWWLRRLLGAHKSEKPLPKLPGDLVVNNDGDLFGLYKKASEITESFS